MNSGISVFNRIKNVRKRNSRGFTLLEIMIVIIIIAVLASLAMPKLFRVIEFSRSAEAVNTLSVIRKSIIRCFVFKKDVRLCQSFNSLDVSDPSSTLDTTSHFDYSVRGLNMAEFRITATRNNLHAGDSTSTIILINYTNTVTINGNDVFAGLDLD